MGRRKKKGSGIIETVVGCMVIIPILLFLVDCAAVVIAQTSNDALAKHAARAAAECPAYGDTAGPPFQIGGLNAANAVINAYNAGKPTLTSLASCKVTGLPDNATWQDVTVNTTVQVNMPVPIPFSNINHLTFQAQSTEPVVSQLAPNAGAGP